MIIVVIIISTSSEQNYTYHVLKKQISTQHRSQERLFTQDHSNERISIYNKRSQSPLASLSQTDFCLGLLNQLIPTPAFNTFLLYTSVNNSCDILWMKTYVLSSQSIPLLASYQLIITCVDLNSRHVKWLQFEK